MPRFIPSPTLLLAIIALVVFANFYDVRAQTPTPQTGEIVFSQIYTRGGNPGSTYRNNFIELFNRSDHVIDIASQPFHIASDTGTFNISIAFLSSPRLLIQPGGYLLIEFETNGTSGGPLPFFDLYLPQFSGFSFNLSPSGKIALSKQGTSLFGSCVPTNPGIIDFVGYGATTNCFEGSGPTATLSDISAAVRKSRGCTDANNNAGDFFVGAPDPRNSLWPRTPCSGNAIDEPDFFARQHYSDFLNRPPDPSGLVFWARQIASCATQSCTEIRRINVSGAFFLSTEFQETGFLAYRTYKAAFGNISGAPVPVTLQEFLPDMQMIGQGVVVNQAGWELLLENNKLAFFLDFISRLRFRNAFPNNLTPAQFVDALFLNAGVTPTAAERSAAIGEFGSAATDTIDQSARARALRRVAENGTLGQQEKNRAFVLMQYFGYLRRNPYDAPEPTLDFSGYNFWLAKLNQFNGNFVTAEMVKSFITSPEYRARF